jgi:hypothetical protein
MMHLILIINFPAGDSIAGSKKLNTVLRLIKKIAIFHTGTSQAFLQI